ncbi:HD domain-containing protein [Carboxylicivirga taeanensis]|uniref:HD domain-containing protein n=1 Tax=Carboxylicivirga taeanensis TaxID=1416875 RepID=UPI003F6DB744
MLKNKQIAEIEEWTQHQLNECDAGHDWWHIKRVLNNARNIHAEEGGDWTVILLAVLLHDLADGKFFDEVEALMLIEKKLLEQHIEQEIIDHVLYIIQNMSFSNQWDACQKRSVEFKVVQDADQLDALGAIGIARAFSYGGFKGRDFYDPSISPVKHTNKTSYRSSSSPTINHFYEKLLLLKDKMNTETGKTMASERHQFMETYLQQFFKEWGNEL